MKNQFNRVLIAALLSTSAFTVQAQQTPPSQPPAPRPVAGGPGRPLPPPADGRGGPGQKDQEMTKLVTLTGTVNKAIANDRFEYNGFLLTTGSGTVTVTYPPHLGEQVFNRAKSGTTAKVTGFYRTDPEGRNDFHLVTVDLNGTTVTDTPPVAPAVTASQEQKTLNATIKELRYSPNKNVTGFILSSGEVIAIPPHIGQQLGTQLKAGEKVGVTGFLEPKRQGVVYSQNIVAVRAQTITLNGQAYLVR